MHVINHTLAEDLDGFVRAIASGDIDYTGRWPRIEWQAAYNAYRAFTGGPQQYRLGPFDGMPEWLRRLVDGRAVPDTDTPSPTLCRLWAERLDWFQLVDEHPDELQLWIDRPVEGHQVTADQLRTAHRAVHNAGGTPLLTVHLDPLIESEDFRTTVSIDAFYVVDTDSTAPAATAAAAAIGWDGAATPYFFPDAAAVLREAGLPRGTVTAWEWL